MSNGPLAVEPGRGAKQFGDNTTDRSTSGCSSESVALAVQVQPIADQMKAEELWDTRYEVWFPKGPGTNL